MHVFQRNLSVVLSILFKFHFQEKNGHIWGQIFVLFFLSAFRSVETRTTVLFLESDHHFRRKLGANTDGWISDLNIFFEIDTNGRLYSLLPVRKLVGGWVKLFCGRPEFSIASLCFGTKNHCVPVRNLGNLGPQPVNDRISITGRGVSKTYRRHSKSHIPEFWIFVGFCRQISAGLSFSVNYSRPHISSPPMDHQFAALINLKRVLFIRITLEKMRVNLLVRLTFLDRLYALGWKFEKLVRKFTKLL
jgi:hypothetical protein